MTGKRNRVRVECLLKLEFLIKKRIYIIKKEYHLIIFVYTHTYLYRYLSVCAYSHSIFCMKKAFFI